MSEVSELAAWRKKASMRSTDNVMRSKKTLSVEEVAEKAVDTIRSLTGAVDTGAIEAPSLRFGSPMQKSDSVEGQFYSLSGMPGAIVIDRVYRDFLISHTDIPGVKIDQFITAQSVGIAWVDSLFAAVPNYAKGTLARRNAKNIGVPSRPNLWYPLEYSPENPDLNRGLIIKYRTAATIAIQACGIQDIDVFCASPPFKMHAASLLDPMPAESVEMVYTNVKENV